MSWKEFDLSNNTVADWLPWGSKLVLGGGKVANLGFSCRVCYHGFAACGTGGKHYVLGSAYAWKRKGDFAAL